MKVTPIKQYESPSFPTRSILDERPELLRFIPKRWQTNPVVLAALTAMCAITLGARAIAQDSKSPQANKVAPIFEHGDGAGAFGCIAVNPPIFLSEDEARKVILEEAKRAGINFKVDSLTLDNFPVPITDRYGFLDRRTDPKDKPKGPVALFHNQVFRLDGTDAEHKISFEYVSNEDFESWEKRPETAGCTVREYDLKQAAASLREHLNWDRQDAVVAVFYDPCIGSQDVKKATGFKVDYKAKDMKAEYEMMREKAKQVSSEELRKQVRDFIKWLKAQGVI